MAGKHARSRVMTEYRNDIEAYCVKNGLSVDKVFSSGYCWNDEEMAVTLTPPVPMESNGLGLMNGDIPLPPVLDISLVNGELHFEQTDITYKYLSECTPAPQMAFA